MIYHDELNYKNYKIGNGSHFVYVNSEQIINGKLNLKIAHFPIRSIKQFSNKNILNWIALMFNNPSLLDAKSTIGVHWRDAYKYLLDKNVELTFEDLFYYLYKTNDLETFKNELIEEPLNVDGVELKYTNLSNERSLSYMLVKEFENALKSKFL